MKKNQGLQFMRLRFLVEESNALELKANNCYV